MRNSCLYYSLTSDPQARLMGLKTPGQVATRVVEAS